MYQSTIESLFSQNYKMPETFFGKPLFLLFFISTLGHAIFCQEYNYTHYDVKDGLAGSTVYSMARDKDGFMWYGTETGLSRFDGTSFKNFYTSDGLPDNEIINLFVDSKNRVWIIPFKNSICYYYKGKIYNQENDTLLKQLKISSELVSVIENKAGEILIAEKNSLYIVDAEGKIRSINNFEGLAIFVSKIGIDESGKFKVAFLDSKNYFYLGFIENQKLVLEREVTAFITSTSNTTFLPPGIEILRKQDSLYISYLKSNSVQTVHLPNGFIDVSGLNDSIVTIKTANGAYLLNVNKKKITDTFLKHQIIYSVAEDAEQGLWFSVPEKGVYRLVPGGFLTYSVEQQNKSVFCIEKSDTIIYAGSDNLYIWELNIRKKTIGAHQIKQGFSSRARIMSLKAKDSKNLFVGTDNGVFHLNNLKIVDSCHLYGSIKSVFLSGDDKIIFSSSEGAYQAQLLKFSEIETIWNPRTTTAYKKGSLFFIGTLNGLYSVDGSKKIAYLGDVYEGFKSRINAIAASMDGIMWVATNGSGLIAYKNNKVILNITEKNGLTSNICRNLFIAPDAIWVGTDKGLNKITFSGTDYRIINFTSTDGLGSDIINAVYADGNNIYVGTPEGLSYFDETKISRTSLCNLLFLSINASGKQMPTDTSGFILEHGENHITFGFVGISFKSAGKISYQYRLLGLDTTWRTTNETSITYPSLSSGEYEFQLKAVNKFGVRSRLLNIQFQISKIIWERTWFRLLLIASLLLCIWFVIDYSTRAVKKREKEKSSTVGRIAELEQMALKSQMNPHFIFNCLNSIQHYVIDKDIPAANDFISKFSRLIRLTLENSSKKDISLADEITYISTYLELEQKRFEDRFSFEIIYSGINKQDYFIPPMILQPYIENAIRHGVRYRDDKKGKIMIKMETENEYLVCTISDNGIGRKISQQYKSKTPIEYQSKGMELTFRRVEMFNKSHLSKISIQVNDLEDDQNMGIGTEVIIYFPLKEIQKFQAEHD